MKKYMELIESITCCNGYEKDDIKAKLFDEIYQIAHIANNRCENKHEGRRKKIEEMIIAYK